MPYGELFLNQQTSHYNERFKFTGKERDTETNYDYFGARYYSSDLTAWLSPDPLLDKYPSINPYAYFENNPIKYVDPDGKDAKLSLNNNNITISANYYVKQEDMASAVSAINFWNKQDKLQYIDKHGKSYTVRFNLKIIKSNGSPQNDVVLSSNKYSNSYEIVNEIGTNENGYTITGRTSNNHNIKVKRTHSETLTGAHEVGHTLMYLSTQEEEHSTNGVMTMYENSINRQKSIPQEIVNKIVESNGFNKKEQSLWQKIKSLFE